MLAENGNLSAKAYINRTVDFKPICCRNWHRVPIFYDYSYFEYIFCFDWDMSCHESGKLKDKTQTIFF